MLLKQLREHTTAVQGWEVNEETVQAKNLLFPWHKDDETLRVLFDRLCEEGASVEQELESGGA